jgi:hypothetical protein
MGFKNILVIFVHAFAGWALCGSTMFIGRAVTSIQNTLVAHAIAAPAIFSVLSVIYFKRFNYTSPLQTAMIFVSFIVLMDASLVAPVFEGSYEMFRNALGTWIPFALIFASTYLTGYVLRKQPG